MLENRLYALSKKRNMSILGTLARLPRCPRYSLLSKKVIGAHLGLRMSEIGRDCNDKTR
jgi:hypothetical protein